MDVTFYAWNLCVRGSGAHTDQGRGSGPPANVFIVPMWIPVVGLATSTLLVLVDLQV
jgi:hypothetical protein